MTNLNFMTSNYTHFATVAHTLRGLRFLVVCVLLSFHLNAAALPMRIYTDESLSSDQITSICQDRQGYVWIGTEYGLNKFDGVHVTQYYSDDEDPLSLSDNIIRKLLTDSSGDVWVESNRGVQRYDRLTDRFRTVLFYGNAAANVNDMLETPEGNIWLLSAGEGLFEVAGDSLEARPVEAVNNTLQEGALCDNMYLDSRGRLWIGYQNEGLQMTDLRTQRTHLYDATALGAHKAVDIIEDDSARLTVATYSAILRLNEETLQFEPVVTFPRRSVHRLYKNRDGQIILSTSGNGIATVDFGNGQLQTLQGFKVGKEKIEETKVYAYLEDLNGNHWIGCYQSGLVLISPKEYPFRYLPLSNMETDNGSPLRSVYADADSQVYVCQEKGGVTRIDKEGRSLGHWLGDRTVLTLRQDGNGTFWAGTYRNGLFRFSTRTGQEEWMPLTGTQRIGGIARDSAGNIYTASFNDGLHSYTPDGQVERTLGGGCLQLTNPYLNTLFTTADGRIWIGHYYGIDVYDPAADSLVDVAVPDALRPAIVYAIGQSPLDGSVWVGSDKGLFRYFTSGDKAGQWHRYTTKHGLPNDIVSSFVLTGDGTLWAGTYRGLAQIEPDGRITRYYRGNGLMRSSYLRGVGACTSAGDVLLGNRDGVTWFSPHTIVKDEFARGITLTGMRLGDVFVNGTTLSGGKQIVTRPLDTADEISVSYLDNTFSLLFSSMDFRDAHNVHYEFRFDGEADDQWYQTESGRSEIYFSRLGVGTHRLFVRAYDNGVYSPVKTLTIRVSPPWYRSTGAYVFYLILLLAIVLPWWRNYRNKRLAAINEEKIRFFVDISHELRSPLTLIKSPLDKLLKETHDPQTSHALHNMERNTNRLLTLLNQILSIRKIEKGQMTLHFAETALSDFVGDICHDFEYQAGKRKITINFRDETPNLKVWIDRDHFDKVVTNLIGNAVKYVEDGGLIEVIVRLSADGEAEMMVRDDGPGINEDQLKKVFERFYQTSVRPAAGQMSYGIGLNLTQKIVVLHGGTVTARNRKDGHGSEFVVRLPLGAAHLPKEQIVTGDFFATTTASGEPVPVVSDATRPPRVRKKTTYRIAVVDDDDEIRSFLETELGATYHVQTYSDGQKALEGIVDTLPDLVVSDVVMPGLDGFELLRRLKASTRTTHIPVVLLTTKTEQQARLAGLEQGADAYMDKPFDLEELEARIAGLIANRIRLRGKYSGLQEQEDTVRKVQLKGNDAALMEKIMKTVNERLDDSDFNVEALADAVALSRVQLHRRMKELTGITVGEFIRNLRLQQAARLLEKGDTSVAQVTYAVGFANPTHFTAAFKKHYGITPSEYMAKHRARQNEERNKNEDV